MLASAIFYFLEADELFAVFLFLFQFLGLHGKVFLFPLLFQRCFGGCTENFVGFGQFLTVLDNIFIEIALFQQLFYISNFLISYFVFQTISKIALK